MIERAVTGFTKGGVVAADGIERPADIVILATGFKAAEFLSTLKVTGRDGEDLHQFWDSRGGPEAFLGVATERFPNLFMFYGPNSNSSTGSIASTSLRSRRRSCRRDKDRDTPGNAHQHPHVRTSDRPLASMSIAMGVPT